MGGGGASIYIYIYIYIYLYLFIYLYIYIYRYTPLCYRGILSVSMSSSVLAACRLEGFRAWAAEV